MKLPNVEQAAVTQTKIVDYLLSETHPDGRSKAAFFTSFGFSVESWEVFAQALRQHAATRDVSSTQVTEHGTKYVVEGILETPDRRNPAVRSVWIIEHGSAIPTLVTAYRLKGVDDGTRT